MVSARIQSAYGYSPALLPSIIESQVEGRGKPIPTPLARMLKARNDLPKLTELPDLLGLFADYIAAVHKLTTHFGPKALARYRTMTINTLVDYVEWATGKPHFPQIATLLTAAYYARGSKVVVHADNLRVQYNRHSGRKQ